MVSHIVRKIVKVLLAVVIVTISAVIPLAIAPSTIQAASSTFYPDVHVETTSVDGIVRQVLSDMTWAAMRDGAGTSASDTSVISGITMDSSGWALHWNGMCRGIIVIDTSALPDTAIITGATLSLYGQAKRDDNNWQPNINIYSAAPASNTSLAAGDYNSLGTTAYATAITYNNWSITGYNTFTLNSTGLAAISKTGVSKFGVRNANYDVANNDPAWDGEQFSELSWYAADKGVGYKPTLLVTYTEISTPEITSNAASNIGQTTARLNSTLDNDGNEDCEIRFGYGTTSEAAVDFDDYDTVTAWVDDYTSGEHSYIDVDSLIADTTYYYRVQAKNSEGTVTSDEITFDTEAGLNEPDNFRGIPESTTIDLSWAKGIGASTTLIRYSFEAYPTTEAEGVELYSGTGSSTTHTGLTPGTTVYYSAWGESGGSYSGDYTTLLLTTLAGSTAGVDLTTPVEPGNWFMDVDYTTQSNMPFYSTINDIADSISVPRTTTWMMAAMLIAMILAFAVYRWREDYLSATIVLTVVMALGSAQLLIPGWIIMILVIVLVGIAFNKRGVAM